MLSNLSVAIMAHAQRVDLIPRLVGQLGHDTPTFIDDGKLGVWGNARRAWMSFDRAKAFHLVLEDDCLLCADFYAHVERLLARFGEGYCYNLMYRRKRAWQTLHDAAEAGREQGFFLWPIIQWAHANIYPSRIIPDMIEAGNKVQGPRRALHADRRHDGFLAARNLMVVYPLPSLVDHDPHAKSVAWRGGNGGRQATWLRK